MYVFAPHTVYQALGKHLDDIDLDQCYDELVKNEKIRKKKMTRLQVVILPSWSVGLQLLSCLCYLQALWNKLQQL